MEAKHNAVQLQIKIGRILLIGGILTGLAGLVTGLVFPAYSDWARPITALSIALAGGGLGKTVRYRAAQKDPQTARRIWLAENDERSLELRRRAGNAAFYYMMAVAIVELFAFSLLDLTAIAIPTGDLAWGALAFLVVSSGLIYIWRLITLQNQL